jgi:hypothetical protein
MTYPFHINDTTSTPDLRAWRNSMQEDGAEALDIPLFGEQWYTREMGESDKCFNWETKSEEEMKGSMADIGSEETMRGPAVDAGSCSIQSLSARRVLPKVQPTLGDTGEESEKLRINSLLNPISANTPPGPCMNKKRRRDSLVSIEGEPRLKINTGQRTFAVPVRSSGSLRSDAGLGSASRTDKWLDDRTSINLRHAWDKHQAGRISSRSMQHSVN